MSQPKRIWVLTYEYEPNIIGGLGIAATNLSRSLSNYNVKVTVISRNVDSRRPNISRKRNLSVIRFPLNRTFYGKKTRQFKPRAISRWLGKRGFALPKGIHIHSISFERMARYLQSNHRIPVVYTCHSLIVNEPGSMTRVNRMAIKQQIRLLTITRPTGPAIAQAILNVWNNRKQTERRIVAGRQVAKRYRWSTAARKYLRLFQQIEKQRRLQSRAVRKKGGQSW